HPVLAELTERLHAHYGDALISVALRGSVARGTDVIGVSDLDLVLFLSGASDRFALQSSLMPGLRIETALVNADTFPIGGSDAWMRFILALSGWHVWGVDIIATLPPPHLGPHAMAHLPRADRWLAGWQVYWADETDAADRKDICQWLMKRIVRSLMESQMLRLGAYSRDIYPCAQTAAAAFPDQQSAIWQAAEYAIAPTHARCQIARVVAELEPLLLGHQASLKG
ncbi:MAG: hypothetical protein AAFY14_15030, partial [Pseudomonadota bacterium]